MASIEGSQPPGDTAARAASELLTVRFVRREAGGPPRPALGNPEIVQNQVLSTPSPEASAATHTNGQPVSQLHLRTEGVQLQERWDDDPPPRLRTPAT